MTNRIRKRTELIRQCGGDPRQNLNQVDLKIHDMTDVGHCCNDENIFDDMEDVCDDDQDVRDNTSVKEEQALEHPEDTGSCMSAFDEPWEDFVSQNEELIVTEDGNFSETDVKTSELIGLEIVYDDETTTNRSSFVKIIGGSVHDENIEGATVDFYKQTDQTGNFVALQNFTEIDSHHPTSSKTMTQSFSNVRSQNTISRSSLDDETTISRLRFQNFASQSFLADRTVEDATCDWDDQTGDWTAPRNYEEVSGRHHMANQKITQSTDKTRRGNTVSRSSFDDETSTSQSILVDENIEDATYDLDDQTGEWTAPQNHEEVSERHRMAIQKITQSTDKTRSGNTVNRSSFASFEDGTSTSQSFLVDENTEGTTYDLDDDSDGDIYINAGGRRPTSSQPIIKRVDGIRGGNIGCRSSAIGISNQSFIDDDIGQDLTGGFDQPADDCMGLEDETDTVNVSNQVSPQTSVATKQNVTQKPTKGNKQKALALKIKKLVN